MIKLKYRVEVKAIGGWTLHSEHATKKEAIDQADMVRGRVVSRQSGGEIYYFKGASK